MTFESFAQEHGLVINHLVRDRWTRVPTVDKPHSRNGAYIWDGKGGAVQNWALHEKPIPFLSDGTRVSDPEWRIKKEKSDKERTARQHKAVGKAAYIMRGAKKGSHPYMDKKGFSDQKHWIFEDLLIVPMRIDQRLVGCQTISADGTKKFLYGQITKGAEAVIDNKGTHILCEGYATGLSVRRALKAVYHRYTIHICFSAANILQMAEKYPDSVIIADNDTMGIRTAKKTKLPYWVSPVEGEDANDFELRAGSLALGISIIEAVQVEGQ